MVLQKRLQVLQTYLVVLIALSLVKFSKEDTIVSNLEPNNFGENIVNQNTFAQLLP